MTGSSTAVTTPAKSLENLLRELNAFETSATLPIGRILQQFFGADGAHADFYSMLSAIHGRFDEVVRIILRLPALESEPDLREKFVNAAKQLSLPFQIECAGQDWSSGRARFIDEANLERLSHAGSYMRADYGFKVLDEDERQRLLSEINDLLADLDSADCDIPIALRGGLRTSISGLKRLLEKFKFYGYAELHREIASAASTYNLVQDAVGLDRTAAREWTARYWKTIAALSMAVCWVGSFDQGVATISRYTMYVVDHLTKNPERNIPLPPPTEFLMPSVPRLPKPAGDRQDDDAGTA